MTPQRVNCTDLSRSFIWAARANTLLDTTTIFQGGAFSPLILLNWGDTPEREYL